MDLIKKLETGFEVLKVKIFYSASCIPPPPAACPQGSC